MRPDSQPGIRPGWNGVAMAFVIVVLIISIPLLSDDQQVPPPRTLPPATVQPGHTITLDELEAMLSDSRGEPPVTFELETPDGPVTVVVPTTTTQPRPAPTTTTTTTTTQPPRPRPTVPPVDADDILDDLLGRSLTVPTIPEGAGGGT